MLGPGDAFFINLKISIVTGVILAMPVILYQAWAFVSPGLTPAERRAVRPWVPLALLFFALGVGDRLHRAAVRDGLPAGLHRRRPGAPGSRPGRTSTS